MSSKDPIAALEIGTSNTTLAIGEPEGNSAVRIVALSRIPSRGIRKGQIIDINQAAHSIDSVLKTIERDYGYAIGQSCLALSGPHIQFKNHVTQWQISGSVVTDDDLREIYNRSLETGLDPQERTLLDEAETGYALDGLDTPAPKGLAGRVLSRRSICVHGDARRVNDARVTAQQARLEITDVYFAGTCAANAVLTAEDRQSGVLTIDLGGGSTTYSIHNGGRLIYANILGVGGDHVTNDIRSAFSLTQTQAEDLKKNADARVGVEDGPTRLSVQSSTPGFDAVTVSRRALETIINARLQELFAVILDDLDQNNLVHQFNGGIVLTGGGVAQKGIIALAEHVLGRRARVGAFNSSLHPLTDGPLPASYATVAGLLLAAFHNRDSQPGFNPFKIFGGFFK